MNRNAWAVLQRRLCGDIFVTLISTNAPMLNDSFTWTWTERFFAERSSVAVLVLRFKKALCSHQVLYRCIHAGKRWRAQTAVPPGEMKNVVIILSWQHFRQHPRRRQPFSFFRRTSACSRLRFADRHIKRGITSQEVTIVTLASIHHCKSFSGNWRVCLWWTHQNRKMTVLWTPRAFFLKEPWNSPVKKLFYPWWILLSCYLCLCKLKNNLLEYFTAFYVPKNAELPAFSGFW